MNQLRIDKDSGLQFVSVQQAERMAKELQDHDPEWTYEPETYDNGLARVTVRDEDGNFVGYFV